MKAILKSVLCAMAVTVSVPAALAEANLPMPPRLQRPAQSFSVRCIKTFTDNGYTVTTDVVRACGQIYNDYAVQALQSVTAAATSLNALTIGEIGMVRSQVGLDCITHLVNNGYTVTSDVARVCAQATSRWGVKAVGVVATGAQSMNALSLESLTGINGPQSFRCIKTLVDNGYTVGANSGVIRACTNFNSYAANEALSSMAQAGTSLTELTIDELSRIQ